MDLLAGNVTPAEGESTVRTYQCTYYREKSLGLKSGGFLGITNKRVIFQASGNTPSGRTLIQSEVPIADVSGINSFSLAKRESRFRASGRAFDFKRK